MIKRLKRACTNLLQRVKQSQFFPLQNPPSQPSLKVFGVGYMPCAICKLITVSDISFPVLFLAFVFGLMVCSTLPHPQYSYVTNLS